VPQQLEEAGEKVATVLLDASGSILVAAPKRPALVAVQVLDPEVRPDGFEPPTTWFEARRTVEVGVFSNVSI
jgi:hypothetical protein